MELSIGYPQSGAIGGDEDTALEGVKAVTVLVPNDLWDGDSYGRTAQLDTHVVDNRDIVREFCSFNLRPHYKNWKDVVKALLLIAPLNNQHKSVSP